MATAPTTARFIPGLGTKPAGPAHKPRKQKKKPSSPPTLPITDDVAIAAALRETAPTPGTELAKELAAPEAGPGEEAVVGLGGLGLALPTTAVKSGETANEPAVATVEAVAKPSTPAQQVLKRIKALKKKIQRIEGYENQEATLNEDQRRAIASKPGLITAIKELQDLVQILEDDEKADELRIQSIKREEAVRVQAQVDVAVRAEKKARNSDLAMLLQFLHLYSLFASSQDSGFAPPVLPPVVERATGQELSAVMTLFNALANGPISGGGGDAMEKIESLREGHDSEVIEGVSYAKIKSMIVGLTAPPDQLPPAPAAAQATPAATAAAAPSGPVTAPPSVPSLVNGDHPPSLFAPSLAQPTAAAHPQPTEPNFLQPSELDVPPGIVARPPGSGSGGPTTGLESTHPAPSRQPIDDVPTPEPRPLPPSTTTPAPAAVAAPTTTAPPAAAPAGKNDKPDLSGWGASADQPPTSRQQLESVQAARTLDWAQDVESASVLPPLEDAFVDAVPPSTGGGIVEGDGTGLGLGGGVSGGERGRGRGRGRGERGARGYRGDRERGGHRGGRARGSDDFRGGVGAGGDRTEGGGGGGGGRYNGGPASTSENWRQPRTDGGPQREGSFRGGRGRGGGERGSSRGGRGEYRGRGGPPRADANTPPVPVA